MIHKGLDIGQVSLRPRQKVDLLGTRFSRNPLFLNHLRVPFIRRLLLVSPYEESEYNQTSIIDDCIKVGVGILVTRIYVPNTRNNSTAAIEHPGTVSQVRAIATIPTSKTK